MCELVRLVPSTHNLYYGNICTYQDIYGYVHHAFNRICVPMLSGDDTTLVVPYIFVLARYKALKKEQN